MMDLPLKADRSGNAAMESGKLPGLLPAAACSRV